MNIAIQLLRRAYLDEYDRVMIVSGDSDLIPAIRAVKETFPHKEVWSVIPIGRGAKQLRGASDFSMKMKEKHLRTCQLPDAISLPDGTQLTRPSNWI